MINSRRKKSLEEYLQISPALYLGLQFTTASNASLIMGSAQLMTGLLKFKQLDFRSR